MPYKFDIDGVQCGTEWRGFISAFCVFIYCDSACELHSV